MAEPKMFGRAVARAAFLYRVMEVAKANGCAVEMRHDKRSTYVTIALDTGHAVSMDVRPNPTLCLHWHTRNKESRYPDPFIDASTGVNQHHFGKATSFCDTLDEVIETLTKGLRILKERRQQGT
jgi:hypothetical protein